MFVHLNRKNMLLFYNQNNKTFVFIYHSTSANIHNTDVLLSKANISAVTQDTFCFCLRDVFISSPAEMGLFPTTRFPGNRAPISLQVRCPWLQQCGAWPTRRRARWDPVPVWQSKVCQSGLRLKGLLWWCLWCCGSNSSSFDKFM